MMSGSIVYDPGSGGRRVVRRSMRFRGGCMPTHRSSVWFRTCATQTIRAGTHCCEHARSRHQ